MKKFILLILGLLCVYFTSHNLFPKSETVSQNVTPVTAGMPQKASICSVFYQDVSASITKNGVEIISSSVFSPYYDEVNRNIELHFGIIDNLTAKKLVSLILPAKNFSRPALNDISKLSSTDKQREKDKFVSLDKQYKADSLNFYVNRNQKISEFCRSVDSLLSIYRNNLSGETDLTTSFDIADKVFNYSFYGATENYLLLNSDGLDSYHRNATKLQNIADVILINAGKKGHTSVDSIATITLESSEQAIQFTLNNPKNQKL